MADAFDVAWDIAKEDEFRIGDMVESWAGKGRIDYIRGDKVKIKLADGSRSKFLNMSGLTKITE